MRVQKTNASEYKRLARQFPKASAEEIADKFIRAWNFTPLQIVTERGRQAQVKDVRRVLKR